ncbi:MAG: hypothetical protein LC800_10060 [Acidobacteria bacterium]|nr:hypothetical protein [Acidobacteriota bacterium]
MQRTFLIALLLLAAAAPSVSKTKDNPTGMTSASNGVVHALFDLTTPQGGPFPSNRFTVVDRSQNTGRRIAMPKPDCSERPSDCEDLDVINTLDGFNLQPRLSVPFDGPVDLATVTSQTIFLLSMGDTLPGGDRGGQLIGINQVVWDAATHTLHVESDELLNQHTRYALIVTRGVRDPSGAPVRASHDFLSFLLGFTGGRELRQYRASLLDALRAARRAGVRAGEVASASVFTTLSSTATLEKIRNQIKAATPAPADFLLGTEGARTVFPLDEVTRITFNQQTRVSPPGFNAAQVNLAQLRIIPGAVGRIAFGKYLSPDYRTAERYIPQVGTRRGTPAVQTVNEIYFNLYLPSGPTPSGGWPVAIFGTGSPANKNTQPFSVAAVMAAYGIATISINTVGHGFGPLSTLTANQTTGDSVTFSAGGRSIDENGDNRIEAREGRDAATPYTIYNHRGPRRATTNGRRPYATRPGATSRDGRGRRRAPGFGSNAHVLLWPLLRRALRHALPRRRA